MFSHNHVDHSGLKQNERGDGVETQAAALNEESNLDVIL